jgi:hypothetical protein
VSALRRDYCFVGDIDNSTVARLSQTKSAKLCNLQQVNERGGEPRRARISDSLIKRAMGSITVCVGN